jgi:2'-5' RNA ligase
MMPRFFLAVPLPDDARNRLVAVQPVPFPGLRVLGWNELHLTLHFLGELDPSSVELVRKALAGVRMNAFTMTLRGVGRFPPEGCPRVLWVGVEHDPALLALHAAVALVLSEAIGFHPEERPYSPHVTLARLNEPGPGGNVERYLEENMNFQVSFVAITQFVLYSSDFIDGIPHYREVATYSLPN